MVLHILHQGRRHSSAFDPIIHTAGTGILKVAEQRPWVEDSLGGELIETVSVIGFCQAEKNVFDICMMNVGGAGKMFPKIIFDLISGIRMI